MEELFQKIIDNDFADVAGLRADASIPLSQSLVNEIIASTLQGDRTIQSCEVIFHEQNHISVYLKTSVLPWVPHLRMQVDRAVDLASFSSPKVRAWLQNNRLLAGIGSFLRMLPGWLRLYGDQLVLDLGYFVREPEQKRLFELIKSLEIRTEEGKAILDVKIEADSHR